MKHMTKKAIAFLLAVMLIISMFTGTALAEGTDEIKTEQMALNETVPKQEEAALSEIVSDPENEAVNGINETVPKQEEAALSEIVSDPENETVNEIKETVPKQEKTKKQVYQKETPSKPTSVIQYSWNESANKREYKVIDLAKYDLKPVSEDISELKPGWYYLEKEITSTDARITMSGEVNLILTAGCTLNANKGIEVGEPTY